MQEKTQERLRKPLNKGQLAVLLLLYQYRFLTADRLAQIEQRKRYIDASRSRLNGLYQQGYIGRHYDTSYKLRGKPASFYLLPKGITALKQTSELSMRAVKALYNDKAASDTFISTSLTIFDISMKYQVAYPDTAQTFTRSELAPYDYLPQPTPDLYVSIQQSKQVATHLFVDFYSADMQFFVAAKRIKKYLAYAESGAWQETGTVFPSIITICPSQKAEAKLRERITFLLTESGMEVQFYTTTYKEVMLASLPEKVYRKISDT